MKKIARTIIITILICLLIILLKNEYGRFLLYDANYGMQVLLAECREKNYEGVNLFVGSSMFRQGLNIHELYGAVGGNEFVLTFNGNQPFHDYYEVQYLLDSGVEISHLFVDMYGFSAASEPWLADERVLLQTDISFKWNIWKEIYNTGNAGIKDFWEMFVKANNDVLFTWPIYHFLVNESFYRGGNLREVPGLTKETFHTLDMPSTENLSIQENQREYLQKIISLCCERGIPLTFLETPKYIAISRSEGYVNLMQEYVVLLQEKNVEYYLSESTYQRLEKQMGSNLDCDENHIVPFDSNDASFFMDYVHLSTDGKKEFSHNLIVLFHKHLSAIKS